MLQFEEVCKHIYIFPYTKIPPDHERLVITGMVPGIFGLNIVPKETNDPLFNPVYLIIFPKNFLVGMVRSSRVLKVMFSHLFNIVNLKVLINLTCTSKRCYGRH